MTKVNNFYVPKVDSLRVRVPLCDVEIIDRTLIDNLVTVLEDTGEVIEEKKGKPFIKETSSGLHFKIWARNRKDISESEVQSELYFLVNAKHLKERYFEGITIDNIEVILNEINALKVIKISKENFLNCDILDVDLCFDFEATVDHFHQYVVKRYNDMAIVSAKDIKKSYGFKTNLGLELNKRDNQTPSKCHAKFYHKGIELDNNSTSFADKFLKGVDYKNICRFEFNLKNRRWFQHYGIKRIKTLKQLLVYKNTRMVFQDVYRNWFIQREIKPMTSMYWYQCILQAMFELSTMHELDYIKHRAEALAVNRKQIGKIREQYHQLMKVDEKQFHEARRIELTQKLDEFFGVENRTYDVRTNVSNSDTNKKIDINDQIPF